jgi:hypothetical protein
MGRIAINAGGGVIGFYPDATGHDGSNSMIYLFNIRIIRVNHIIKYTHIFNKVPLNA